MILILSKDNEPTTNEVIKWIRYLNKTIEIIRLNTESVRDICLTNNEMIIITDKNKRINLKTITSVWYRRGGMTRILDFDRLNIIDDINFRNSLIGYLNTENYDLIKVIFKYLSSKKHINKASDNQICKIEMLKSALIAGIKIPPYMITNNKEEVREFLDRHKRIITKPIGASFRSFGKEYSLQLFTSEIDSAAYGSLPRFFFPSFFQKLVEKKYELRIVFLNGLFFSMAIFSQLDQQTSIDFRDYIIEKNGRWVPYNLTLDMESKLMKLMKLLDLNSGSIDILVDKKDDFYFLEVNPIGQFGMTSKPCNYFIERTFANYLIK